MIEPHEKLSQYTILYCEDNKDLQLTFKLLLKDYSDNILLADNGKEGLKQFKEKRPDIIITDIKMPVMDGISMIQEIRKIDQEVPIMIVTSYDDKTFLFRAIDEDVDKFLVKPLHKDPLLEALNKIICRLEDKKAAQTLRAQQELQKLQETTKKTIAAFVQLFQEPVMVVRDTIIEYCNDAFTALVGDDFELLKHDAYRFDQYLQKKRGYCASLDEVKPNDPFHNKVYFVKGKERKVFRVIISSATFETLQLQKKVYVFEDITLLEYQRIKIENYNLMLESYVIDTRYGIPKPLPDTPRDTSTHAATTTQPPKDNLQTTRSLQDEESKRLRADHSKRKIDAKTFLQNLESWAIEDVQELEETEDDIEYNLYNFTQEPTQHHLYKVTSSIEKYGRVIQNLHEFDELAKALFSIKDLLNALDNFSDEKIQTIQIYLEAIIDDLKKWRRTIFQEATTDDIHYLDASLFSSCLQLEMMLTNTHPSDEEDDIEFF